MKTPEQLAEERYPSDSEIEKMAQAEVDAHFSDMPEQAKGYEVRIRSIWAKMGRDLYQAHFAGFQVKEGPSVEAIMVQFRKAWIGCFSNTRPEMCKAMEQRLGAELQGLLTQTQAEPPACDYRKPGCTNTGKTINGRWICSNHAEQSEDAALPDGRWIPVSERLPEPGTHVLAYVVDPARPKWSRRIRAQYATENTLELSDDHDPWEGCTQIEEGGQWFVQPGWYETNEYEETNWRVSDTVTHWMPLPTPPTN